MEIKDKVVIKEKQSVECPLKNLVGTLKWRKAVDLDLWCFVKTKNGREDSIGFNSPGRLSTYPHIELDKDAGVGDQGGDNEENIRFQTLEHIDHAFISANIYGKTNANFSSYDGAVIVKSESKEFTVPLTSSKGGNWCVIAHIDNTGSKPQITNINQTIGNRPKVSDLIARKYSPSSIGSNDDTSRDIPRKRGFIKRLFGG